jgi:hypothetical protein
MQHSATAKLKTLSRQLLGCETAPGKSAAAGGAVDFRVCEKLRLPLGKLMGVGGFHALLSRALVLARAEVPWLAMLEIKADGSLEGRAEIETQVGRDEFALGEVELVAHLLGLLVTFVGPALTLALVREAWPEAAINEIDLAEGEKL